MVGIFNGGKKMKTKKYTSNYIQRLVEFGYGIKPQTKKTK